MTRSIWANKLAIPMLVLASWGIAAPAYLEFKQFKQFESDVRSALALEQINFMLSIVDESDGVPEGMTRNERVEAVRGYYPSGSKQIPGSRNDLMVEKYRSLAIRYIESCPCGDPG